LAGGAASGVIANHFIPPSMMGGLLSDYNPFPTPNNAGDLDKAKAEMAQSKYDHNGDGVCDDPACNFQALTVTNDNDAVKALQIAQEDYKPLGLNMDIKQLAYNALVTKCSTLAGHPAYCQAGWVKDFPDPYTFFYPLLDQGENGSNYSFMGTTPEDLQKNGYQVPAEMPSITDDINTCHSMPIGDQANQCWAALDQKVTEQIAPLIPRRFFTAIDVLGPSITAYSFDQWGTVGDPSRMALAPGSS